MLRTPKEDGHDNNTERTGKSLFARNAHVLKTYEEGIFFLRDRYKNS